MSGQSPASASASASNSTPSSGAAATERRPGWSAVGTAAALATSLLVLWFHLVRHGLPGDPWARWLGPEAALVDASIAARSVGWAALYGVAVAVAAFTAWPACRRSLAIGRSSPLFLIAALGAAGSGAMLALVAGPTGVGGTTMQAYACGLGVLWAAIVVRVLIADRRQQRSVVAQWTVYAASLTLLPLTIYPTAPVWGWAANLSPADALVTAATVSFISHLLVAHAYLFEVAARSAPGVKGVAGRTAGS